MAQSNYQALVEKWGPILEHDSFSAITDQHKRSVTATILENTERALMESGDMSASMTSLLSEAPANDAGTGGFGSASTAAGPTAGYDPVLISLVRRAMPNLMAYDIAGVQPMTGPTGLIFAMRSRYTSQAGGEAFYGEADTDASGRVSISADGQTVAIGAQGNYANGIGYYSGHVRVYRLSNNYRWVQLGQDIDAEALGDRNGWSVSISADGETVAIGAPYNDGNDYNSGHVRVYQLSNGSWTQLGQDIFGEAARDKSGESVSISADGQTVAIGAPWNNGNGSGSGHVRVYRLQ